jgi:putative oxidoreductase
LHISFADIANFNAITQAVSSRDRFLEEEPMSTENLNGWGVALTRVSLGSILVAHSIYLKLVVYTLPGTAQFFTSLGLPAVLAYVVFIVEAVAGVALIVGWQSRAAALAVVPILLGATWAHWSAGWLFTNSGGGWEYPALLAVFAAGQALLGDGAFSVAQRVRMRS